MRAADETAAMQDRELLAAHTAGNRDAFEELVRRHQDRLWAIARRTLGDPEDAADALQEGLIKAMRAAGSYRGEAAVSTWLHRIVVNACLDVHRRRATHPTVALGDREVPAAGDHAGSADAALTVLAALRRLPIEQAAAVVLVDVEGFPVAEAAAILEVPEGTVKSRCARARARLAELIGGNGQDPRHVQPGGRGGDR